MRVTRHFAAAAADEKVEVAAFIGLQHVVDIEALVAAPLCRHRSAFECGQLVACIGALD